MHVMQYTKDLTACICESFFLTQINRNWINKLFGNSTFYQSLTSVIYKQLNQSNNKLNSAEFKLGRL